MAVAARDAKLVEYEELLSDLSRFVSELELHRIVRDLKDMIVRTTDHQLVADLYILLSVCHGRLGHPNKALNDCRHALLRLREPTRARAVALRNQAGLLFALGRYQEAAIACLEASKIPAGYDYVTLANLAEALYRMGETAAALQTFQEALHLADFANPIHCFEMASQAAELGLDQDAVELFAKFVVLHSGDTDKGRSAIETIIAASAEHKAGLKNVPALDATIRRMAAMTTELARLSTQSSVEGDEAPSEEADDVYEATRRLREEALAHTLLS